MQKIITKRVTYSEVELNNIQHLGDKIVAYKAKNKSVCLLVKSPSSDDKWFFKSLGSPNQNGESFRSETGYEAIRKAISNKREVFCFSNQKEFAKFILDENT